MPAEKHVTSIRLQDLELLHNLSAIEGRPGTEILHRALVNYAVSQGTGAKVPAKDVIPLFPKIAEASTPGATVKLVSVKGSAPNTHASHETKRSRPRLIAQTRQSKRSAKRAS